MSPYFTHTKKKLRAGSSGEAHQSNKEKIKKKRRAKEKSPLVNRTVTADDNKNYGTGKNSNNVNTKKAFNSRFWNRI